MTAPFRGLSTEPSAPGLSFRTSSVEPASGASVVDVLSWCERQVDEVCVLVVCGELDFWSGAPLERYLVGLLATGRGRIVLDVAGLYFCDAGGIGILERGHTRARAQGAGCAWRARTSGSGVCLRSSVSAAACRFSSR